MNTDIIIEALQSEGADLVVRYGSTTTAEVEGHDVDLFALGTDTSDRQHFQLGQFDVIRQSWTEFDKQRERLDPVYCTEPLLTGEPVYDSKNRFESLQKQIREQYPDTQAIRHNLYQGTRHLQRALAGQPEQAAEPLRYVTSYWLFALWYNRGETPISLSQLLTKTREQAKFKTMVKNGVLNKDRNSEREVSMNGLFDLLFSDNVFSV